MRQLRIGWKWSFGSIGMKRDRRIGIVTSATLLGTSATLVVTGALLVVTMFATRKERPNRAFSPSPETEEPEDSNGACRLHRG